MGPGLYKATMAVISSKVVGCSSFKYLFIPSDSNWNTDVLSAFCKSSKVFGSSSGILSKSIFNWLCKT